MILAKRLGHANLLLLVFVHNICGEFHARVLFHLLLNVVHFFLGPVQVHFPVQFPLFAELGVVGDERAVISLSELGGFHPAILKHEIIIKE